MNTQYKRLFGIGACSWHSSVLNNFICQIQKKNNWSRRGDCCSSARYFFADTIENQAFVYTRHHIQKECNIYFYHYDDNGLYSSIRTLAIHLVDCTKSLLPVHCGAVSKPRYRLIQFSLEESDDDDYDQVGLCFLFPGSLRSSFFRNS